VFELARGRLSGITRQRTDGESALPQMANRRPALMSRGACHENGLLFLSIHVSISISV
jgi:hypothetical protein